ncbi:hypothetical protein [Microbulbifer halophilus]|uniref:Uncharacterized protein n=1 Tax=Microbulbifer halophilus TaxID=453963 RepID=A0ABW5EFV7_9GAMM|nr:hypothetical protein [Microbulbifer halophilus]MCW8128633.1 hypothetical protein [Microbulbifer halophilus]
MPRLDISRDLVHWIKAETDHDAFEVLRKIVSEKRIIGGSGHIKGDYVCVCFTEAPIHTFHDVIGRYRPFGIRITKNFAYDQGGRPVIYQSDAEYVQLPEALRWRHVRYEPNNMPPIDFSWEREWRIKTGEVVLPPGQASVIVPCESWADQLSHEHLVGEESRIQMEAMAYGSEWLMQTPDPFYYPFCVVNV